MCQAPQGSLQRQDARGRDRREERSMSKGRFGIHGGQYIPETLMNAVLELEEAYNHYKEEERV